MHTLLAPPLLAASVTMGIDVWMDGRRQASLLLQFVSEILTQLGTNWLCQYPKK